MQLIPPSVRNTSKENISKMVSLMRGSDAEGGPRIVILCYHSVAEGTNGLAVDPLALREQIGILQDLGYEFKTFGKLAEDMDGVGDRQAKVACLTFDDGYEDNFIEVAPLLARIGISATMFVVSGLMLDDKGVKREFRRFTGYDAEFMNADQVGELSREGFEIGAHTHTHRNMASLPVDQTREELRMAKSTLESVVGQPIQNFAYPFGKRGVHYRGATVKAVKDAGFSAAASVAFRGVPVDGSARIFELPRFFVNRSDTREKFRQKIRGDYDWLGRLQERTPSWLKAIVSPEDMY